MAVPDDEAGRAARAQGMTPGTAGALKTELESLQGFKKRVDGLLMELRESEADPKRISEERMDAGTLGANFAEATGLYRVYGQVHDQLTTLSRLLSGQIDGLSMAVSGAEKGYSENDYDVARRMWAIQTDLQKHYDPKRDPYAEDNKGEGGKGDAGGQQDNRETDKPSSGDEEL